MAPPDREPRVTKPAGGRQRTNGRRAAAAVLGSVAALGGAGSAAAQTTAQATGHAQRGTAAGRQARRAQELPAGERALLSGVFSALSQQAPAIAKPILDEGVVAGTITQAQEDAFLARLASVKTAADGSGPTAGAGQTAAPAEAPPSPAGRALFQEALGAIRAELPIVALPLLVLALAEGSITEAQATRLRGRFDQGARLGFGLVMAGPRAVGATRLP